MDYWSYNQSLLPPVGTDTLATCSHLLLATCSPLHLHRKLRLLHQDLGGRKRKFFIEGLARDIDDVKVLQNLA